MIELFRLALLDYKSQIKHSRMLFFLISITMTVFLCIHSLAGSVRDNLTDIIYTPFGREFLVWVDGYQNGKENLEKIFADKEWVGDIVIHMGLTQAEWDDIEGRNDIVFNAYISTLEEYIVFGETGSPKRGEIILPKYLYAMGDKNQYQYIDGSDYVGKTIHITVRSAYTDHEKEYVFKVKAAYDNIRSMCPENMFCLNEEDAVDIYQYHYMTGEDEYIESIRQQYPDEPDYFYDALRTQYNIGIGVKAGYDFETASKMIADVSRENIEEIGFLDTFFNEDSNGINYMEFIIFLSDIMSLLLAGAAIVSMILMFAADMRRRKYDFALRYSIGYTVTRQTVLYGMEKLVIFAKAAAAALLITGLCIVGGNYIIQNKAPFYRRSIVLSYDWAIAAVTLAVVFLCCMFCVLCAAFKIRRIHMAEALKEESL